MGREWLEGMSGLALYLALKLGGYAIWSCAGARWLGRTTKPVLAAFLLGPARLVLGWITGLIVAPLAVVAVVGDHVPLFYFTVLVAVRWLEWGVVEMLIPGAPRSLRAFVLGGSTRGRVWRLIGIGVSYLADAPFLLAEGFPHGRIFC